MWLCVCVRVRELLYNIYELSSLIWSSSIYLNFKKCRISLRVTCKYSDPNRIKKKKKNLIYAMMMTNSDVYACSFCSMLATRPLVSTWVRRGLLKYSLLSNVLSPKTGVGIRLRKKRKAPSPAMPITTSIIVTLMPADPWDSSLTTWAAVKKTNRSIYSDTDQG